MFSFAKISVFCSLLALSLSGCLSLQTNSVDMVSTQMLNSNSSKNVIDWERPFGIEVGKSNIQKVIKQLEQLNINVNDATKTDVRIFNRGIRTTIPNWKRYNIHLSKTNPISKDNDSVLVHDTLSLAIDENNVVQSFNFVSGNINTYTNNVEVLKKQYPNQASKYVKNSLYRQMISEDIFLVSEDNESIYIELIKYQFNVATNNLLSVRHDLTGKLKKIPINFTHDLSNIGFTSSYSFNHAKKIPKKDWSDKRNTVFLNIISPKFEQAFELAFCQKLQDSKTNADEKAVLKKSLIGYCKK